MRTISIIFVVFATLHACGAQTRELHERRSRAAAAFPDGVLLVHAKSSFELAADGFRQDPLFYYYTGLENTVGALLAIDGRWSESWLFLPFKAPFEGAGIGPEISPGPEATKQLGIEHVVDWVQLEDFL